MPTIDIDRSRIPLWRGANGRLKLEATVGNPNAPLVPGANPVLDTRFDVEGGRAIALGAPGSVNLGIQAGTRARMVALFQEELGAGADLATRYTLGPSLTADNLLLAFEVGGDARFDAEGSFRYSVLKGEVTLSAGVDAGLLVVRAFPRSTGFLPMVTSLVGGLQMPAEVTTVPAAGDLLAFEFGGYLNFGVGAAAGYQIKGTQSFRISEIALSEHYALSIIGRLAFTAAVAGRFSVEVRRGADPAWTRVVVRRGRSRELQVAADVKTTATLTTEGLPRSGKEFLGALIGVQAKNWLNMIDGFVTEAGQVDTVPALKAKLDGLAKHFIGLWIGKAIDELLAPDVEALQARIKKVVDSYRKLDAAAIALFDRFFDPVLDRTDTLVAKLGEITAMTSWDALAGEVDPLLWNVIRQLTDGDPLGWALGRIPGTTIDSLEALHRRADQTRSLIEDAAHAEIRRVVRIAKEQFAIDHLLDQLDAVLTPEALTALAARPVGHFVERLIGEAVDRLNGNGLRKAFEVVRKIVAARDRFFGAFDTILQEAASQTFALNLHAAYNAADERQALIDVEIRLLDTDGSVNPSGRRLMQAAGRGDFQEVLARIQPSLVRLHEGVLTHRLSQSSLLQFNVAGWHRQFNYEALHRVIVDTEQQIRPSGNGMITVFTTTDMTAASERRTNKGSKSEEAILTNFLLRVMAETRDVLSDSVFDAKTQSYALDVITSMSARYRVSFTDADTSLPELVDYLQFARTLGLDAAGATLETILPLLERRNGAFGRIDASYDVRYAEAGVRRAFTARIEPTEVRAILRRIVLANYFNHPTLGDVGWLYASDDVRRLVDADPIGFVATESQLGSAAVRLSSPIPGIRPPSRFANTAIVRHDVAVLLRIEDQLIRAFTALDALLHSPVRVRASELDDRLKDFGKALNLFDGFDNGENSVFAVIDGLILRSTPARDARSSSLVLTSTSGGEERTKVFTLQASASAPIARAAGGAAGGL